MVKLRLFACVRRECGGCFMVQNLGEINLERVLQEGSPAIGDCTSQVLVLGKVANQHKGM